MTDMQKAIAFLNSIGAQYSVEKTDDLWFDDIFHQNRGFRFTYSKGGEHIDHKTTTKR